MGNVRNRVNIKIVTNENKFLKLSKKPEFKNV